jgi:hypothetical protein
VGVQAFVPDSAFVRSRFGFPALRTFVEHSLNGGVINSLGQS